MKWGNELVAKQNRIIKLLNFAAILKMPVASMCQDNNFWRVYLKGRLN